MRPRLMCALVCGVALGPASAFAQTVSGSAEWSVARGSNSLDGAPSDNSAFWQRYAVGFDSFVLDPRLLKYNTELSWRTNSLSFGSADTGQAGRQSDLGYRLGLSLFPARPFPFFIQASRDSIAESGDYPSSSGIRGGLVVPSGNAPPEFQTRTSMLALGWQLKSVRLPNVDVGYRSGASTVDGGPYHAEQNDSDLHASVSWGGDRARSVLRYQRTAFDNVVSQAFSQKLNSLDYDFTARLGVRSRFTVRSGRRTTYSLFDLPAPIVDPGTGSYRPPAAGAGSAEYVITGLTFEPSARLSLDVTGSFDRQGAGGVATNATLASASARYDVGRGLSVNATGTYGDRGEIIGDAPITALTRSGQAGIAYRAGRRWLEGSVQLARGAGANTTPDGRFGRVDSWSGQTGLSSSFRHFNLSAGLERQVGHDEILDFGNFDSRRSHASVGTTARRLTLNASWDQSLVTRGLGDTFATFRQQTFTGSTALRVRRDAHLTASAGGFDNRAIAGRDHTLFYGGGFDATVRSAIHLTTWLRLENTGVSQTSLDQHTFSALAAAEYRFRVSAFALEYRHNGQDLRYGTLAVPYRFRGHQLVVRIARRFGVRL